MRSHFYDLKQRPQHAAGGGIGAGDKTIRLLHGEHHGAKIIGLQNRFARFRKLQAFTTTQGGEAAREIIKIITFSGIDDANPLHRNIQVFGELFDFGAVTQKNRRAEAQRIKLARSLEHARLRAFRKNDPFRMALQFFNDVPDKSHGAKLAASGESAIILM